MGKITSQEIGIMKHLNYNPTAPVTVNSFRTLLSEWDGADPAVRNVLAGMMMLLRQQGLGDQVDTVLEQTTHE